MDLGVCVVLVDESGERSFVTSPGAELTLRGEELALVTPGAGDVVYLSGYNVVYPEVAEMVSEWLRDVPANVVVAFDPGPRAADIRPSIMALVLERTDWLLCNASEARHLSGEVDASSCAQTLRERGSYDVVVVRDGAQGCAGASGDGVIVAPGFETRVVDTNGAGDVHNGVVIAELSRGTALGEALLRANAAAALSIETFGPVTCPIRELVDALLLRQPRTVTLR
jgi:sugar/nucleoside kinase (ribokinase family)